MSEMARSGPVRARQNPRRRNQVEEKIMGMNPRDVVDDIDDFHMKRDKLSLDVNNDRDNSDDLEDDEMAVMNLEGGSDDSNDDESDDDKMGEEELTGLAAKMVRQAKFMKQRAGIENEDDEEEEEEEKQTGWGRGKKIYYNADNVDFEMLSSDEEAPGEEEEEVRRLQQVMAASLRPEDYEVEDSEGDPEENKSDREETLEEAAKRQAGEGKKKAAKVGAESTSVEEVKKDISSLSKEEQKQLLMSDAPELLELPKHLRENLNELRHKVQPLLEKVKDGHTATKEGISYLEVKHMLQLSYCQSIVFYLLLKAEARSVRDHPVIPRLLELRTSLERLRPIDKKLQPQIQKLLDARHAPVLDSANGKEGGAAQNSSLSQSAFTAGGMTRKEKKLLKKRKARMEKSAEEGNGRLEEVREEMGSASKAMLQERARLDARTQEAKQHIAHLPSSNEERRKAKHTKRPLSELTGMGDDIEDDLEVMVGLNDVRLNKASNALITDTSNPRTLSQIIAEAGRPVKKRKIISGDSDLPVREDLGDRRRNHDIQKSNKALVMDDNEGSDGGAERVEPEEDEFYKQARLLKEAKQAAKAAKFSRTPIIPAEADDVEGKRHITYQMEKNRGLTPHRKKAGKNPRKKYKLKHEKAVIRRKGQVRGIRAPTGNYGGESTGIRTNLSRSVRFNH